MAIRLPNDDCKAMTGCMCVPTASAGPPSTRVKQNTCRQVHTERREGPYIGGADLPSCGFGMPTFGEHAPVSEEELAGSWTAESSARFMVDDAGAFCEDPAGVSGRCAPLRNVFNTWPANWEAGQRFATCHGSHCCCAPTSMRNRGRGMFLCLMQWSQFGRVRFTSSLELSVNF